MLHTLRILAALAAVCALSPNIGAASFITFDSGQVRPLALSPDGTQLFAVNTPDNRLEIFAVSGGGLVHSASVPVGLEPVAVAARSNSEVWVVNHLSDSVSVVDVSASPPRVTRTLLVGDEPRDIVIANGTAGERVMITTARRGQNWANHSTAPEPLSFPNDMAPFRTEGIGRALVWMFDPDNLGSNLEGDPLQVVTLFGDTPRALTVSADGNSVYASIFHSGNQTTVVSEGSVCDTNNTRLNNDTVQPACTASRPGGLPLPHDNVDGLPRPETGLIVKLNRDGVSPGEWQDELGRDWSGEVRFDLPDLDVFEISTLDGAVLTELPHVGTINFNMVTNPVTNRVYVSNTEAINEVRFEGPGIRAATAPGAKVPGEPTTVQGHLHESRITVIDGSTVTPRHLNKHIDYDVLKAPPTVKANSLATPMGMAVTSDGSTLYVAAFGSGKVGIFDTAMLEADTFTPSSLSHISVGGGPSGLVLDETNDRLYVFNRFDNTISVVDTNSNSELVAVPVYNPEPAHVVEGRPFLYDANLSSSNGEASCSSCHVFGDLDSLAWDLGNPDDEEHINNLPNNNPIIEFGYKDFHPMKGPMTTQTLRGMAHHGAMHWRGDRSVGFFGSNPIDKSSRDDEILSFKNFIVAFDGLLGLDNDPNGLGPITETEMDLFTSFILDVFLPPNPIRNLDNTVHSLSVSEASLLNFYNNVNTDSGTASCNDCHELTPANGFFGANGGRSFENETQHFKVAHLRNVYQKIGMFGMPAVPFIQNGDNGHKGDQIRGFGILHDGAIDTVFRFLRATVFSLNDTNRRDLEALMLQFPSNLAPAVGQQITLTDTNAGVVGSRIDLLLDRSRRCFNVLDTPGTTECDAIVQGVVDGEDRGWVGELQGPCGPAQSILFRSDKATDALLTDAQLRTLAATPGNHLTYTCAPPGTGERMAIDRDEDGYFDQDEQDAGSDPANPLSIPGTTSAAEISSRKILIKDRPDDNESKRKIVLLSKDDGISFPAPLGADDPRCNGSPSGTAKVTVSIASSASGQNHTVGLPCENWQLLGRDSNPRGYKYKDKELDDGTVKIAVWKEGKLKMVLQGKGSSTLDYDLVSGVSQGVVDILLDNQGGGFCMACGPHNGKDGSDGKKFLGKSCAAPASCGL